MSISTPEIGALAHMSSRQRADAIYRASQSEIRTRLWSAALGEAQANSDDPSVQSAGKNTGFDLIAMMTALARQQPRSPNADQASKLAATLYGPSAGAPAVSEKPPVDTGPLRLGANAKHAETIAAASERTGMPASALAAIVDAEASKKGDGSWNAASSNPHSSARGLTQFLSRTWVGEAERPGTFLNGLARANNWLGYNGKIRPDCRSTLLSLRLDARCSIEAAADYAKANVAHLQQAGITVGNDPTRYAQLAYVGHQLGAHDAVSFLTGHVSEARARKLLVAQIGNKEASRLIQDAGGSTAAHQAWLVDYVDKHIEPSRYVRSA